MITRISGYDREYAISNDGILYEVSNGLYGVVQPGNVNGYRQVKLYQNGVRKSVYIHRLVAEYFVPNIHGKEEVNHINGIKDDNRYTNLEWCTRKENIRHAVDILGMNRISVVNITTGVTYQSLHEAARGLGIHTSNISNVINGKRKTAGGYKWRLA